MLLLCVNDCLVNTVEIFNLVVQSVINLALCSLFWVVCLFVCLFVRSFIHSSVCVCVYM
jgi:hypothetical protein